MNRLRLYTSIVPNHRQKIVQEMKFYAFVHFGINTFTGREWGKGKEYPSIFNPVNLDTDQWCEAIKAAGMKGVILTCKHHDGFCLWQTNTTEHSIKNSPYKDGKGDVLAELRDSCNKYGLKLGVYLSPWDRNSEYYATDKYMDFYIEQLRELLTNYGEIFMLWLDGACGSHMDGKPAQVYDFNRIYSTALKLQPNIAMSGCAPDIRWVGNESGVARESEWNVVPQFDYGMQNLATVSQQDDNAAKFKKRCIDAMLKDMGSREFLSQYDDFMWYPAEVDVSIRMGWFYHSLQRLTIRSINNLMNIYYNSVGGNSLLLLNIPPNRQGKFSDVDVKRLRDIGKLIDKEFKLIKHTNLYNSTIQGKKGFEIDNLYSDKTYSPNNINDQYTITANFSKESIDRVTLREDTDYSQRVESFEIYTTVDDKKILLYKGTVIGFNKIAIFKPIVTDNLTLNITSCRFEPYINYFKIHKTGGYRVRKTINDRLRAVLR